MSHRDTDTDTDPAPTPTPQTLRARYEDVVWHEGRHDLDAESFESVRGRARRGWGVGALVVDDGRVLLVREDDRWYAPGGMLESGESPEEGAIREVREETGLAVQVNGLGAITEQTFVNRHTSDSFAFHFAMFDASMESTALTDDPGLPDEEITTVEWHASVPTDTYQRDLIIQLLERQQ